MNQRGRAARRHRGRLASAITRFALAGLACVAAFGAVPACADDDLAGRAGRVASVQGTLYRASADSAPGSGDATPEWSEIGRNEPVAQGDDLRVDHDGLAEVDYGAGQFRLADDTSVHVSRLDERALALFVASGRVIIRVRVLDPEDTVRVDTPATQVLLNRAGLYRVDVDAGAARTTVAVREGEADVAVTAGSQAVLPGQAAIVGGRDTNTVSADVRNAGRVDDFDIWSAARDRVYERPRENAYVSRQMIGQSDLDGNGAWQLYPDYGAVWFPVVDPEWVPYRYGHWTWLPGWGYAWVDDAPWGYAPFHYGRWAYISGHWGWCPGAYVARPVWAPALVAWYGGGSWNHSTSNGRVYGWIPLGWGEPLVPWWRSCATRCYARYNQPYRADPAQRPHRRPPIFANWRVPGGVTAVSSAAVASGRPVAINRIPWRADIAFEPARLTTPMAIRPQPVRPAARAPDDRRLALPAPGPPAAMRPDGHGMTRAAPAPPGRATTPAGLVPAPVPARHTSTRPVTVPAFGTPSQVQAQPIVPPRGVAGREPPGDRPAPPRAQAPLALRDRSFRPAAVAPAPAPPMRTPAPTIPLASPASPIPMPSPIPGSVVVPAPLPAAAPPAPSAAPRAIPRADPAAPVSTPATR